MVYKAKTLTALLFALSAVIAPCFGEDPVERQRPGEESVPVEFPPFIYEAVPDLDSSASDFVPIPDRWRMFYTGKWYDPYNQNVLKGDIPVFGSPGNEWFFNFGLISDTLVERNNIALPVGGPSTSEADRLNTIGNGHLTITATNLVSSFSLIRGNTTYRPPDFELRATPVFNFNYVEAEETGVLRVDPATGKTRDDAYIGFLELFADYHLTNLSHRYDFVSLRGGIQEFQSDFRGFVFTDSAPGVRIFGNLGNNRHQYNLAWFSRLEKDTNSGLNQLETRHEDVYVLNYFHQDIPTLGHQISASVIYRDDYSGSHADHYDNNGVLRRPASIGDMRAGNIRSTYLGLAGDGHIGRVNNTTAFNYVFGEQTHNPISQRGVDIQAFMLAEELSYDIDWIRVRASFMWASGDNDPFDAKGRGFDAIQDNPNFAGGDLSFWQRQGIPFIAGGGVALVNRNSLLPNLRSGKEEGQSNFVNPGLLLYNLGVDFELLPELKLITNASYLQFAETAPIEALRQDGSYSHEIGWDLSAGFVYRPFLNNNVILKAGAATLVPGTGIDNLYGNDLLYDFFGNVILQY